MMRRIDSHRDLNKRLEKEKEKDREREREIVGHREMGECKVSCVCILKNMIFLLLGVFNFGMFIIYHISFSDKVVCSVCF